MTCIAAVTDNGKIWMGADSAGVDDNFALQTCDETKVWVAAPFVFGMSGSYRAAQLVRYHLTIPPRDPKVDVRAYITGPLVDAVRYTLSEGGALTRHKGGPEEFAYSSILIGYEGRLFEMFSDFGVGETPDGFSAIGCGAPYALGALAVTTGLKPKQRVLAALKASERFNAGVRGPFHVEAYG